MRNRPKRIEPKIKTYEPSQKPTFSYQPRNVKELKGSGKVVNCTSLHVRNGGSVDHKVIGYLQRNDTVTITGEDSSTGWYRISWKGSQGFCSNKYIEAKTEASANKEESPKPEEKPYDLDFARNENRTLTGDIKITPDFTLMPRDIISLQGEGLPNILRGDYYVSEVTIDISSSSGITMKVNVQKNAFKGK